MILDVTAGNRMIWGKNKQQSVDRAVFLDKEYGFRFNPDIIADNTKLPFRTNFQFTSILFDPPWGINMPPWWKDKTRAGGTRGDYFGDFKSKRQLLSYIHKAQKEFQRYTNRLCFKWGERNVSLWKILPFFKDGWIEVSRREIGARRNVGGRSKNRNWWVTFLRSSLSSE